MAALPTGSHDTPYQQVSTQQYSKYTGKRVRVADQIDQSANAAQHKFDKKRVFEWYQRMHVWPSSSLKLSLHDTISPSQVIQSLPITGMQLLPWCFSAARIL